MTDANKYVPHNIEIPDNADETYRNKDWLKHKAEVMGMSLREMAEESGVSHETIRKYINEYGINMRYEQGGPAIEQWEESHGHHPYHDVSWLRRKYVDEKMSCPQIANLCDPPVHATTIYNALEKSGIPIRSRTHGIRVRLGNTKYTDKEWLQNELSSKPIKKIAKEQNVSTETIRRYTRKYGISQR